MIAGDTFLTIWSRSSRQNLSLSLSLSATMLVVASLLPDKPLQAQIELDSQGRVGIGLAPTSSVKLRVRYDTGPAFARYGIDARASNAELNYGVLSYATHGEETFGVYAVGEKGSDTNYGVLALAYDGEGTYGIFAAGLNGTVNYAGFFGGNVHVTGSLTGGSDGRFKENVESLSGEGVLEKLMQLEARRYTFRRDGIYRSLNLPAGRRYGFVAQDVEPLFPELVSDEIMYPIDRGGGELPRDADPILYKGLNYMEMIPLLVQAIREQQEQIDAMRAALEANGIVVQ